MATVKPPILTVNFFRAVRSCRPQTYQSIRQRPSQISHRNGLHTSSGLAQQSESYQRYGPAATPSMPPPPKPDEPYLPSTEQTRNDATELETKKAEHKKLREQDRQKDQKEAAPSKEEPKREERQFEPQAEEAIKQVEAQPSEPPAKQEQPLSQPPQSAIDDGPLPNRELDMVLSIPSPSEVKSDGASPHPHLEASPYEHHFDTYTLVQDLCKEQQASNDPNAPPETTFSDQQAITLMKAIRLMLAENLDLAKDGLVSKSDTENETYLFRAACSELKTTMQTSRFMEAQKQRSQRAQVQHEHDILNQKVGNDIASMREELKGMFNDRKLGLAEEKRRVDGKIQNLSYRISVDLNSEARSDVESLRWVLTRRAALAIGAAATMVLSFLQYYSVKSREQAEIEKKRRAARKEQEERLKKEQERFGSSGATVGRSTGTQTDGIVLGGTAGGNYEESLG